MATDLNKVILIGRLTKDPVLQSTATGMNFTKISIANNRRYRTKDEQYKEEVNFFDCIAWAKTAETISKYLTKGKRIAIEGSLRFSSWENTEGKKQSKVEINIDNFQFLESRNSSGYSPNETPNSPPSPEKSNDKEPSNDPFQKIDSTSINDDDIPF